MKVKKNYLSKKSSNITSKKWITNNTNQRGITLIALIVTIIVLLILAGVSINMALGNNGIFEKAKESQNKMNEAIQNDMEGINYLNDVINNYLNSTDSKDETTGNQNNTEEKDNSEDQDLPETSPYLPDSTFKQITGTSLETGLVIEDKIGNQYVWIEVPTSLYKNENYNTKSTKEDQKPKSSVDYEKIEYCLQQYAKDYREETNYADEHYSDEATGLTSTQYTELKQKMLKSVYENGGFWIGRYEAGITTARTKNGEEATVAPLSQANVFVYNFVTCEQAQTVADMLTTNDYKSSLLFGIQWDLVLKHIETKGVESGKELSSVNLDLTWDSSEWGNYTNNLWTIYKPAQYSIDYGKTYIEPEDSYKKPQSDEELLTTGALNSFSKYNIYDFAGNVSESTLEVMLKKTTYCVDRGGSFVSNGSESPVVEREQGGTGSMTGFRIALYK